MWRGLRAAALWSNGAGAEQQPTPCGTRTIPWMSRGELIWGCMIAFSFCYFLLLRSPENASKKDGGFKMNTTVKVICMAGIQVPSG